MMTRRIVALTILTLCGASFAEAAGRALAIPWPGSAREAILFRTADGDGAAIFAPAADGAFSLLIHPGLGPRVVRIAYGDVDGDGLGDLVAARADGTVRVRLGAASGDFVDEPAAMDHATHAAMGHVAAERGPTALEQTARARLDAGTLRSTGDGATSDALATVSGKFLDPTRDVTATVSVEARPRLAVGGVEALVPNTTFNVQVGSEGFSFSPSTVSIAPGDTVHWIWAGFGHNVVSGTACTANGLFCSPSNTNCATAPSSNTGATYERTFPAAGTFPYFCGPHCSFGMTGQVEVGAPAPGTVPDNAIVPGTPLQISKSGASLSLIWGTSCAGTRNYGIYEGSIPIVGGVYDHTSILCNTANATNAIVTPAAGNRYYLVVAHTGSAEGSYGTKRVGGVPSERPQGTNACQLLNITTCP